MPRTVAIGEQDFSTLIKYNSFYISKTLLQDTVHAALNQIIRKNYAAALQAERIPADRIRIYGFAFQGADVFIDGGFLTEYPDFSA